MQVECEHKPPPPAAAASAALLSVAATLLSVWCGWHCMASVVSVGNAALID